MLSDSLGLSIFRSTRHSKKSAFYRSNAHIVFLMSVHNVQLETGGAALRQCVRDTLLEFLAAAAASTSPHPNIVAFRGVSFLADCREDSREEVPEFRLAFELCSEGTIFSVVFPSNGSASPLQFHDRLRLAREVEQRPAYLLTYAIFNRLNFLSNYAPTGHPINYIRSLPSMNLCAP